MMMMMMVVVVMVGPTPKREQADIYDSWCAVMNGHDGDGEDDCHDMVTEMMVTVTMLKVIPHGSGREPRPEPASRAQVAQWRQAFQFFMGRV